MKVKIIIISFLTVILPVTVAAEMLEGKLLTIQPGKDNIILTILVNSDRQERTKPLIVSASPPLPASVKEGKKIRVWGDFSLDSSQFIASEIRGCRYGCNNRNHGIRRRIHQHRQRKQKRQHNGR